MYNPGKLHQLTAAKPPDGTRAIHRQPLAGALHRLRAAPQGLHGLLQHLSHRLMRLKVLLGRQIIQHKIGFGQIC
jgi:hypothetical protein